MTSPELTKRVAVGARYLTREGHPVGPIEKIDVNGWAWCGSQCWDALTGQFYANGEDERDLIAVIPDEDFRHWQQWMCVPPDLPDMVVSA